MQRLIDELTIGHIEVLLFLEKSFGEVRKMEDLESVFGSYKYRNHGQLDRMAFRWILADLASRMVIHLGDLEDMNEYKTQRESIVTEDSRVRALQITKLGRELIAFLT